jgi:hypothetical protein
MTKTSTNPYISCYLCSKKFVNWYFLDKHMQNRHPAMVFVSGPTNTACADGITTVESAATDSEIDYAYDAETEAYSEVEDAGHQRSSGACVETVSVGDGSRGQSSETTLDLTSHTVESNDTKRKLKREPRNARKKRRKGGYSDKGRIAYRQENGAGSLVTGNERSCLPDAVWNVAPDTLKLHGATYEGLKACMPDEGDTTTASIDTYLHEFGLALTPVSGEFLGVKGGAELALLQRASGSFVAQLRVTIDNSDDQPDLHFVAFDGQCVKDNVRTAKVKVIDAGDRATACAARAVFKSLFPGGKAMVSAVYQLS